MTTVSRTTCETSSITADCTVDAAIARSPDATSILNSFNIDTCCGGRDSIGVAAVRARVNPQLVIEALSAAQQDDVAVSSELPLPPTPCGCGCR